MSTAGATKLMLFRLAATRPPNGPPHVLLASQGRVPAEICHEHVLVDHHWHIDRVLLGDQGPELRCVHCRRGDIVDTRQFGGVWWPRAGWRVRVLQNGRGDFFHRKGVVLHW